MNASLPLSARANAAWTCTALLRAEKYGLELANLGCMLDKESILAGLRDDPNPGVRRLALEMVGPAPGEGRAA